MWPLKRKEQLVDDLSTIFNVQREEVAIDRMTEEVKEKLERIMKMEKNGELMLDSNQKTRIAEIIKKFQKDQSAAKFQLKNASEFLNSVAARGRR